MKLFFIGADHEVTGSCHLLQANGAWVMLDCGMEQGRDLYENVPLPVPAKEISALILSHAHIDHSGMIPKLVHDGFAGPVYCTDATRQLCEIMLRDSAHIQESEAEWKNRKAKRAGEPEVEPPYTVADAENAMKQFVPVEYGKPVEVAEGVTARLEDVGHLLGSASVHLTIREGETQRTLVFSGDIGNINQPLIKDPGQAPSADYVIMESTYGDRTHGEAPDLLAPLVTILQSTFDKGGNVVIPCFAVGRTQQMLYLLRTIVNDRLVSCPGGFSVYVDSPLAVEATAIFEKNIFGYYDDEAMALINSGENPIRFPGLRLSVSADDSKAINFDDRPKVILSASGMCEAGRIRHHLKHNLWKANSTVVFVGYQTAGTLGRKLLDGAPEVTLFGEKIEVNARIVKLEGVSGHADREGLLRWVTSMTEKPRKVFVVHGEDSVCDEFAKLLTERTGFAADAPFSGAVFDMAAGVWEKEGSAVRLAQPRLKPSTEKKNAVFTALWEAGQRLLSIIRRSEQGANKDLVRFTGQINSLCDKWDPDKY